jgi:hypothetical protein
MNPFSKRNLLLFVLIFAGFGARAQRIHFSDIKFLYGEDSTGFRNFCKTHSFLKTEFYDHDSSYYLTCSADTGRVGLSRAFGKYTDTSGRKSYILNYFFGNNLDEIKELEIEIKRNRFKFIKHRPTNLPGNFAAHDYIYEKGPETASLEIQYKTGVLVGYTLAYFRRNKKAG